jgi:hypothetical protein
VHQRLLAYIIYGGAALLAPLLAFGHNSECLQAKLEVIEDRVHLDIIADYGMNPLIKDEASAKQALHEALRVKVQGEMKALTDLAPLDITWRYHYDPQSPLLPSAEDTEHQLLGAHWSWPCTESSISFAVADNAKQQVMLWQPQPDKPARWVMLLAGDSSPPLSLPAASSSAAAFSYLAILAVVILALLGFCYQKVFRKPVLVVLPS